MVLSGLLAVISTYQQLHWVTLYPRDNPAPFRFHCTGNAWLPDWSYSLRVKVATEQQQQQHNFIMNSLKLTKTHHLLLLPKMNYLLCQLDGISSHLHIFNSLVSSCARQQRGYSSHTFACFHGFFCLLQEHYWVLVTSDDQTHHTKTEQCVETCEGMKTTTTSLLSDIRRNLAAYCTAYHTSSQVMCCTV